MDWQLLIWKLRNLRNLIRGWVAFVPYVGKLVPIGRLYVEITRTDGTRKRLGLVSTRVVTTAGVNYLVDCLQGTSEPEVFTYHGMGTGSAAENVADTALVTPVESRVSGTSTEGASPNIYRTVATITASAPRAVVEHGIFSASTAGTLLDRSVFSVINLAVSDSIQFTYELTLPAGS